MKYKIVKGDNGKHKLVKKNSKGGQATEPNATDKAMTALDDKIHNC